MVDALQNDKVTDSVPNISHTQNLIKRDKAWHTFLLFSDLKTRFILKKQLCPCSSAHKPTIAN